MTLAMRRTAPLPDRELVTPKEAANYLGMTEGGVYYAFKNQKIGGKQAGKKHKLMLYRDDVLAYQRAGRYKELNLGTPLTAEVDPDFALTHPPSDYLPPDYGLSDPFRDESVKVTVHPSGIVERPDWPEAPDTAPVSDSGDTEPFADSDDTDVLAGSTVTEPEILPDTESDSDSEPEPEAMPERVITVAPSTVPHIDPFQEFADMAKAMVMRQVEAEVEARMGERIREMGEEIDTAISFVGEIHDALKNLKGRLARLTQE